MAILESNTDLDVKGRVLATTVPNSTGSIVTWNASTRVFGTRTNAQIIAALGLQTTLTAGNHINITSNVISVKPTLNTWIQDSGNNNRILMDYVPAGSTNHNDLILKQISADGYMKFRNSKNEDFFVYRNSTEEVSFPLVGVSTGTTANIVTMGSTGAMWRSNRTIGDLIQTLSLGTNPGNIVLSNGGGNVYLDTLYTANRQDANVRELAQAFRAYRTIAGNTNYPTTSVSTGFRIERSSSSTGIGMDFNTRGLDDEIWYKTFNAASNEFGWYRIASREYVDSMVGGNFVPYTGANQAVDLNTQLLTSGTQFLNGTKSFEIRSSHLPANTGIPGYFKINLTPGAFYGTTFNLTISGSYNANLDYGIVQVSGTLNPSTSDNNQDFIFHTVKGFTGGVTNISRGFYIEPKQYVDGNGIYYIKAWKRPNHNIHIYVEGSITVSNSDTNYEPNIEFIQDATPVTLYNRPNYLTENEGRYLSNTISDLGYTELFSGDLNTLPDGNYVQAIGSSSTNGASGIGAPRSLISFGARSSGDTALQSDILIGLNGFAVRNRANNIWLTAWHSGNLLQSSIDNWNTAFGWGDFRDYGLDVPVGMSPGQDLSTLDFTGFASTYSGTDFPSGVAGNAFVINNYISSSRGHQIVYSASSDRVFFRRNFSGFTPWVEFIHDGNLNSQATSLGFIKSASLSGYVPTSRTLTAGNGLSGGGNLTANRTFTLGTPSAITLSSTNSVATSSHTHAFTPGGTTAQYIRGDGSLATFPSVGSGSVTSVGMTVAGNALGVTPATITSAGTFALAWGGTTSQYVRGDGSLATMPSTPTVNNGQLTMSTGTGLSGGVTFSANQATNATFTVAIASGYVLPTTTQVNSWNAKFTLPTGGTTAQYIRGDGSLATFPNIPAGTVTSVGMTIGGNALNTNTATITSSGTFGITWAGNVGQYINGLGNLATMPTIPIVNNGTLTMSTGTGLSGGVTFGANQASNATFSVSIATGYTLPTNAQVNTWNSALQSVNLSLGTRTATTMPINNSGGTNVILPIVTTSLAGLMGAGEKMQLDTVVSWGRGLRVDGNGVYTGAGTWAGNIDLIRNASMYASSSASGKPFGITSDMTIVNFTSGGSVIGGISRYSGFDLGASVVDDRLMFRMENLASDKKDWHEIVHSGNISSMIGGNFVPYTGATANVNLGTRSITSTGGFIGNATTASTLATARTINGTSFNGSANITTARWGTARNITIGNTTKSVNGSANVAWSLAEIGVANGSHDLLTNITSGNFTNGGYILLCLKSNSNAIRIAGMLTLQRHFSSRNPSNALLNFSLSTDNLGDDLSASFTDITTSNLNHTYNFVEIDYLGATYYALKMFSSDVRVAFNFGQFTGYNNKSDFRIIDSTEGSNEVDFPPNTINDFKINNNIAWHSGNFNPSQLVYTGSNGINVTGQVISPTYGTTAGTIAQGNDVRINNGQTAFGWGNHALAGYALSSQLSGYVPTSRTITINGVAQNLNANRTWTIPDNDTITRLRGTISGTFTSGDLTLLAGANTTITQSGANITITSTNTNTTYSAGTGLSLTGTTFANTAPNATHTGDVTGATALTIANNAVTHSKYQNIPTARILGRVTAGTGNIEELTVAQMQTMLGFSTQTLSNSTSNLIVSNTVQRAALTGDVTASQNSNATTISNGVVTNAKLANMGIGIKGRNTGTGAPLDLTVAQVQAMLGVTTVNNGSFTVQGTGALTGSGSTSANASANTTAVLDLSQNTKNRIQQGVDSFTLIQNTFGFGEYQIFFDVTGGGQTVDPGESFKTIVCPTGGGGGNVVNILDHTLNGAELYLQTSGTQQIYTLPYIDRDGQSFGQITVPENSTRVFFYDLNENKWRFIY